MSTLKTLLTKLEQELRRNSKGELLNDPAVDNIDPIDNADIDTPDEFEKEVQKKVKGESSSLKLWSLRWSSGKGWKWKFEREVSRDNSEEWLKQFQKIEPDVDFLISSKKPTKKIDKPRPKLKEAQELESKSDGDIPHTHKYIPGKNRSEESLGHDHPLEYKNGKVVMLGKGPHEGHYHEV